MTGLRSTNRRCVFLDRDGVLNEDRPDYVYRPEHIVVFNRVYHCLRAFKEAGFLLIVITNQSGVSKGIYTEDDVKRCNDYLQKQCSNLIDAFYFSPYHPSVTASLSRKPGTLLFERAIAKFSISVAASWMMGDRHSDLIPARKLGMKTAYVGDYLKAESWVDIVENNMDQASLSILSESHFGTRPPL